MWDVFILSHLCHILVILSDLFSGQLRCLIFTTWCDWFKKKNKGIKLVLSSSDCHTCHQVLCWKIQGRAIQSFRNVLPPHQPLRVTESRCIPPFWDNIWQMFDMWMVVTPWKYNYSHPSGNPPPDRNGFGHDIQDPFTVGALTGLLWPITTHTK